MMLNKNNFLKIYLKTLNETNGKIDTHAIRQNVTETQIIDINSLDIDFERFNYLRPSVEI